MKEIRNCDLYTYNTMRLHSVCDVMYVPQSKSELMELIFTLKNEHIPYHILAAGSNIIFAEHIKKPIVNLMEIDKSIVYQPDGLVSVGASVRVQTLIRDLQKHGLGGIEYLYSVPSSIGGATYMNAGRGKDIGLSISDYIEKVEYFSPRENIFKSYIKRDGDFSYRHSLFQETDYIITNVTFRFKEQTPEETEKRIIERIQHSKKYLSADKPSCGSVFCQGNRLIYRLLMGKKKGGAVYSKKTPNWITNVGNATADDVMTLIHKGEKIHRFFRSNYKVEIRYFE